MADINRDVVYTFKMIDNVSQPITDATDKMNEANGVTQDLIAGQEEARDATEKTTEELVRQETQLLKQVTALVALKSSVSSLSRGLISMGLVTGENAERLQKLNSAFQMMAGAATMIKAVKLATDGLRVSQTASATVEAFRAALKPWQIAAVAGAAGIAVGATAAIMMNNNKTNNTTNNFIVENAPENVAVGQSMYAVIGGGML